MNMNNKYIRTFKIDIMMYNDNGLHAHLLDMFENLNAYHVPNLRGIYIYFGKSIDNCYLMYNGYSEVAYISQDVWYILENKYKLSFDEVSNIVTYFIKDLYPFFSKVNYIGWSKHFESLNMNKLELMK